MGSRKLLTLFGNKGSGGYSKYATADGMSFRDAIDAEQLLKAADDLDNSSYWDLHCENTQQNRVAVHGIFRITNCRSRK